MTERVRVGVIGCGFFARNHLHAWQDLAPAGADLVAVCDIDPAKAKAAAEAFEKSDGCRILFMGSPPSPPRQERRRPPPVERECLRSVGASCHRVSPTR